MWDQIIEDIRAVVLPSFESTFPGVGFVLDNEQTNTANLGSAWVDFEVRFYDGSQTGMAASPKTRVSGFVYATCFMREGTGVMKGIRYLQHLSSLLGYASIGAARLQAPSIGDPEFGVPRGWEARSLKVPFYADLT